MSLLTIEDPADGTEAMQQFSMENFMPKLYEIFKQAVLSNNYPVIGLFMVGGGAMLKIINADIPIFATQIDIQTTGQGVGGGYTGGILGDWLRQLLGTGRYLTPQERRIQLNLSDVLVMAGLGLLGSPLIGKVQSLLP